jgi:hypothetical protein
MLLLVSVVAMNAWLQLVGREEVHMEHPELTPLTMFHLSEAIPITMLLHLR